MAGSVRRGQLDAIGHPEGPVRVIRTPAGNQVEETARNFGVFHFPGILVLDFVEAALGAPVAERLPLLEAHLLE